MKGDEICYSKHMLSHHRFIAVMCVLILSVGVGGFFLYQRSNRCISDDEEYCAFLSNLKPHVFDQTHGTFTTQTGKKASKVNWVLDRGNKQIQVFTEDAEAMNMIVVDDQVYMKDYRDGLWWQQNRRELERYIVELEFDPEVFIPAVIDRFEESVNAVPLEQVPCGQQTCIRYQIGSEGEDKKEYIDIDPNTNTLVRYAAQNGEEMRAFSVQYQAKAIVVPDQTKQAAEDQNIFMEPFMERPAQQSAKDLEYVQEFEREMNNVKE